MQILVYILIFLSGGLVIVAIVATFGEVARLLHAGKKIGELKYFAHQPEIIESVKQKEILAMLDTINLSDIKYSDHLDETLKTLKDFYFPDNRNKQQ